MLKCPKRLVRPTHPSLSGKYKNIIRKSRCTPRSMPAGPLLSSLPTPMALLCGTWQQAGMAALQGQVAANEAHAVADDEAHAGAIELPHSHKTTARPHCCQPGRVTDTQRKLFDADRQPGNGTLLQCITCVWHVPRGMRLLPLPSQLASLTCSTAMPFSVHLTGSQKGFSLDCLFCCP